MYLNFDLPVDDFTLEKGMHAQNQKTYAHHEHGVVPATAFHARPHVSVVSYTFREQ